MTASGSSCRLSACSRFLAGLGARLCSTAWGRWAKAAIVAALLEGIVSIVVMMPVPLSYFSPLVGDCPGRAPWGWNRHTTGTLSARKRGRWLSEHTRAGRNHPVRDDPPLLALSCARSEHCPSGWPRSIAACRNGTCSKTGRAPFRPSIGRSSLRASLLIQSPSSASR